MSDVVAWLESPEGLQWSRSVKASAGRSLVELMGDGQFSVVLGQDGSGVRNPEHDPCGRPPMGP